MSRLSGPRALVLVVGITGMAWFVARSGMLTPQRELSPEALQALETRGVLLGAPDAPVHVVLLSDYQCEACAALELAVWDSLEVLADGDLASVRVIHTPFPAHRRARRAAELHACAEGTGAGWSVHERLFETRLEWAQGLPPDSVFREIGGAAGLDSVRIAGCLEGTSGRVERGDFLDSVQVRALPTVVVNGRVVRPTASALLDEISRAAGVRWSEPRGPQRVPGCRAIAPVSRDLRRRAQAICWEALARMEAKLALTASIPMFVMTEVDSTGSSPVFADGQVAVLTSWKAGYSQMMDDGTLHHELAHAAFFREVERSFGSVRGGAYGTVLPDVLDDGVAILGEPPASRARLRRSLPRIEVLPLRETLAVDHPRVGEAYGPVLPTVRRSVRSPCRGVCPDRPHPEEWMVVTERWNAGPQQTGRHTADTTFWPHEPPAFEVGPRIGFYVVAEAVIAFLEEQFADPTRLRDYVFDLVDPSLEGADAMDELAKRLGVPEADIEARWLAWVRSAKEAAG